MAPGGGEGLPGVAELLKPWLCASLVLVLLDSFSYSFETGGSGEGEVFQWTAPLVAEGYDRAFILGLPGRVLGYFFSAITIQMDSQKEMTVFINREIT